MTGYIEIFPYIHCLVREHRADFKPQKYNMGLTNQITQLQQPKLVWSHRVRPKERREPSEKEYEQFLTSIAQASSLVKLIDGTVNNAAWAACLDAYELLKPLKKRLNRQVKGGGTAGDSYKRVFKALKTYQRNLIYASENRFFHVADMTDDARSFYSENMTDEEYYDFWASFGFKAYDTNKNFFTCLVNKLRLIYEHGGIKDAEAAAWSMGAYMGLSVASDAHSKVVMAIAEHWGGHLKEWQWLFKAFDLTHVEKLWGDAHKDMFPELDRLEFSDFEFENINISFNQWAERLTKGNTLAKSRIDTIADFTDDIFRTKGCAKKAIKELTDSKLFQLK